MQSFRDLNQQGVAGGMAQAVVDELEAIQIEKQDGNQFCDALAATESVFDAIHEKRTIGQIRERVVESLMRQFFFIKLTRRNVAERPPSPEGCSFCRHGRGGIAFKQAII